MFIDTDLTFEFDLLKISKENPNIQSQSNLPIINNYSDTRLINPIDNDIQERPLETIQDYDNIRPRPSVAIQDDDNIQLQRTVAIQDYDIIQPRTSATPADDNVAKHISDNLPQRNTIHSPVEEQNQFDERTGLQNRVTTPTNPIPGTSMSNAFDPVDGIRRITMNTPTGILNTSYQRFDLDKQQNISRISDLCEVPTPQFGEDIVPIENNDRQRFPSPTNQLLNTSKKLKPHKDIIHQGKQYVQFANGHKFSVYFLEVSWIKI